MKKIVLRCLVAVMLRLGRNPALSDGMCVLSGFSGSALVLLGTLVYMYSGDGQ